MGSSKETRLRFWNVVSSLMFVVVGIMGISMTKASKSSNRDVILELFELLFLVAAGSIVYHLINKRSQFYPYALAADLTPIFMGLFLFFSHASLFLPLLSTTVWILLCISAALFVLDFTYPWLHPFWHVVAAVTLFYMYSDCLQGK